MTTPKIDYNSLSLNGFMTRPINANFLKHCVFLSIDKYDNQKLPDITRTFWYMPRGGKVKCFLHPVNGIFQTKKIRPVADCVKEINQFIKMGYRVRYARDKLSMSRK